MIKEFNGLKPRIDKSAFVAKDATIVGDVEIGKDCSVWFGAVIRGDMHYIKIGKRVSIQDLSVVHITHYKKPDKSDGSPTIIGDDVTIGHKALLHGCKIENGCLIGMGAIILDDAVVGKESIVGAGSLITKNKKFPPRSLILGNPAKVVRTLSEEEVEALYYSSKNYVKLKDMYKKEGIFELF